jgi:hypothetical protein
LNIKIKKNFQHSPCAIFSNPPVSCPRAITGLATAPAPAGMR